MSTNFYADPEEKRHIGKRWGMGGGSVGWIWQTGPTGLLTRDDLVIMLRERIATLPTIYDEYGRRYTAEEFFALVADCAAESLESAEFC